MTVLVEVSFMQRGEKQSSSGSCTNYYGMHHNFENDRALKWRADE